ncbi:MAG: AbrB/MazE/SpoVT family DNA-binding domain-containing protein [Nitrospirae bacterium]|nr:AbrB/MazE/SpoVT family DNA-binding domain-containing protein [Nitrospirota bacterium]
MSVATVTSKGQITIPKKVREYLKIESGDKLEFFIEKDGKVTVLPVTESVKKLKGMIRRPRRPVSIERMKKAVEREASRK